MFFFFFWYLVLYNRIRELLILLLSSVLPVKSIQHFSYNASYAVIIEDIPSCFPQALFFNKQVQ